MKVALLVEAAPVQDVHSNRGLLLMDLHFGEAAV